MNYTNINIKSDDKTFKYIVEYFDDPGVKMDELRYFENDFGYFFFNEDQQNVLHQKNYWTTVTKEQTYDCELFPQTYNISSFDLYFPRFSVDTYIKNVYYVLTLNTWINDECIFLGSYLIDRKNAIACNKGVRKFLNDEYYEYIRVNTIDPFYLIYGDEWKEFRIDFCDEDETQKNNSASNINVTLTPVKLVDGVWIKLDGFDSSQSALVINNDEDSNYLTPKLLFDNQDGNPKFYCGLVFNDVYENDFEEYLRETYQITVDENFKIKYCFVIGDKENPYKYKEHVFELEEFIFDSWNDYEDGMYAQVYVIIQKFDEDIIVLTSNKVFITQEEFKYLMRMPEGDFSQIHGDGTDDPNPFFPHDPDIGHTGIRPPIDGGGGIPLRAILVHDVREIRKVDLDSLDMEVNKYNVVNVIENQVVSVERPADYRSNIVKPVFVKVQETDSIRLYSSVTENIVINLDAYKNKVNSFILKIGNTNCYEIGRINSGIVFKVIGSSLSSGEGTYYILNEDGEMVTNGKYTIV